MGSRLVLQQLDNDSDYSDITRKFITYLGNSSANLALSPLQRVRSLEFGLAHRPLQILSLHRPHRTVEHVDYALFCALIALQERSRQQQQIKQLRSTRLHATGGVQNGRFRL